MLAYVRSDIRLAFGQMPDRLDHRLRLDVLTLRVVFKALTAAPLFDLLPPVTDLIQRLRGGLLRQQFQHLIQHLSCVPQDGHIRRHRFRDRSRIDINV